MDLGGDVRANPKLSGTRNNVFGIQTGVTISFLIKKKLERKAVMRYARRPEMETAEEKLQFLSSCRMEEVEFNLIEPDYRHNWIGIIPDPAEWQR